MSFKPAQMDHSWRRLKLRPNSITHIPLADQLEEQRRDYDARHGEGAWAKFVEKEWRTSA